MPRRYQRQGERMPRTASWSNPFFDVDGERETLTWVWYYSLLTRALADARRLSSEEPRSFSIHRLLKNTSE
jgi:hypothetical protein